jgi:hypothetical protein
MTYAIDASLDARHPIEPHHYRTSVIQLPDGPPLWTMWRSPMA